MVTTQQETVMFALQCFPLGFSHFLSLYVFQCKRTFLNHTASLMSSDYVCVLNDSVVGLTKVLIEPSVVTVSANGPRQSNHKNLSLSIMCGININI